MLAQPTKITTMYDWKKCATYVDDMVIISKTMENHEMDL